MRRCLPCLLTRLVLTREISKNAAKIKCLLGKFLGDPAHGVPLSAEKRVGQTTSKDLERIVGLSIYSVG